MKRLSWGIFIIFWISSICFAQQESDNRIEKRDALNNQINVQYRSTKSLPTTADGLDPYYHHEAAEILDRYAAVKGGWKWLKWGMNTNEVEILLKAVYILAPDQKMSDLSKKIPYSIAYNANDCDYKELGVVDGLKKGDPVRLIKFESSAYLIPAKIEKLPFDRFFGFMFYHDKLFAVNVFFITNDIKNAAAIGVDFQNTYGGKVIKEAKIGELFYKNELPMTDVFGYRFDDNTYISFQDMDAYKYILKTEDKQNFSVNTEDSVSIESKEADDLSFQKQQRIIESLLANKQYSIARSRININFEQSRDLSYQNYALQIDKKMLSGLNKKICKDKVTSFSEHLIQFYSLHSIKLSDKEKKEMNKMNVNTHWTEWKIRKKDRDNFQKIFDYIPITLIEINDANKVIEEFEEVKIFLKESSSILNKALLDTNSIDYAKKAGELKSSFDEMLENISKIRCDYISYMIVSPYLGEAERFLIMAKTDNTFGFGHNRSELEKCAAAMRLGKDGLIMETNLDVRKQFMEIVKAIKEIAGEAEYKQLEVIQTLADKVGNKEPKGSDRWLAK
jgi:hypothetical protein